jgi:thioredoxin reductase (NADPH)
MGGCAGEPGDGRAGWHQLTDPQFLGLPAGISGGELAERAFQQAWMFGAEFVLINGATGLATEKGDVGHAGRWRPLTAPAAMLATGVSHQQPDALGIAELAGAAVPVAGAGETLAAPAGIGGWIDAGGSVPPPPAKSAAKVPPSCLEQRELP